VRVLFTFAGGLGHFAPLEVVARAVASAGHRVAFGCSPPMARAVEAAGFHTLPMGRSASEAVRRLPLRPPDREREERDLRERFARRAARDRAPLILELCRDWQPDVLVCDETDFGAMVAAERLGLPFATVLVIAAGSFVSQRTVGEALNELRAEHGLPPEGDLGMPSRYLVLSTFPPRYRDPDWPLPATAHSLRPPPPLPASVPAPPWCSFPTRAPTVYFTLGTVFNTESGDLFAQVLSGLRELPVNVVATTGHAIAPSELGPQPPHVHVARYIPQSQVLPYCDLVVCHGGSGSVMGALAHGLPMVLIPIGADQPLNGDRCTALGVARVLDAMAVTAEGVRETTRAVLDDSAHRRNAEIVRDEIAALPGLERAVELLERLSVERRPIESA